MKNDYNLIVVTGPTATGKTSLAVSVAEKLNGEIISADSRQVYRGMNIGTGKDIEEYHSFGHIIPYHLIDICDAGEEYNVFRYLNDFKNIYNDIISRGKLPILCGGSGLYIEAVLKDYRLLNVPVDEKLRVELEVKSDEELEEILKINAAVHNISDTSNRKRLIRAVEIALYQKNSTVKDNDLPSLDYKIFAVDFERSALKGRITERLRKRLGNGMVEEAKALLESGLSKDKLVYYGLEYKFMAEYLDGQYSYNDMYQKLNSAIHRFSKRQMTWFRKMEREGIKINWIDGSLPIADKLKIVMTELETEIE
jgi:tRNA dimethylallyltransferase